MKTLVVLLILAAPRLAAAEEGESLLKLLDHPTPALKAVLEDSKPPVADRSLDKLTQVETSARSTRMVAVGMAVGPAYSVSPGQVVELR